MLAVANYKKCGDEPTDHAMGRSRGGLTIKRHPVADGKGRAPAFILTARDHHCDQCLAATLHGVRSFGNTA